MKTAKISLKHVRFMPKTLDAGVLYVSKEFGTAAHLCACGCGSKVRTPLGPTEWTLTEAKAGPSLDPSIGNWQLACRSHYWIDRGRIIWARAWSQEQVEAGRRGEQERREAYYDRLYSDRGFFKRLWKWIKRRIQGDI